VLSFLRKRPLRLGIQFRLLLVTFAIGSLFVLYIVFNTARQTGRDQRQAGEQMQLIAELAAARLDDHIGDVTQLLNALASTLPVDRMETFNNDMALRSLRDQLSHNVSVSLWSADGRNIGSSDWAPSEPRPAAGRHAFFEVARREARLTSEAPVRLQADGEWTAVLALPLVRNGQTVGVVSGATRLRTLPQLLDPDGTLPKGAVVSLANGQGRIIARSADGEQAIGQLAPLADIWSADPRAVRRGSAAGTDFAGVPRIYGYARSRTVDWLVFVGIPVEQALATAGATSRESLVLGLGMLGAGLFIAAWVAGRIARPLRQLSDDARLLGEGRVDHRSSVRSGDEVGLLASTLNRMADTLQERIAAARRSAERLSLALEGSEQALFDWDLTNSRVYFSGRASAMRGGPDEDTELTTEQRRAFVHPDDVEGLDQRLSAAVRGQVPLFEAEFRVRREDGDWIWVRSRGRVVERDERGRALRLVGTEADITRRKAAEDDLRQRAENDTLTGLPNRALFNDRIAGAMARAARSHQKLALLFLDLDHFKQVNDSHGHEAGDALLKETAARLHACVRGSDTVARLGGDEFTVVLEGLASRTDAEAIAAKIVEAMRVPMAFGDVTITTSTSIGVAMMREGETDAAAFLHRSDEALYQAKRRGRDRFAVRSADDA